MMRRRICFLLAAILLFSLPLAAFPASAAETMTTSEEAIAILKSLEGFVATPMYDNGQYSVGYGCSCDKDAYPDGITVEEADALLRERLAEMEVSIRYFISRYGLSLTQNQFDALMLFTYNVGPGWVNADGVFRQAVISGATGNEFLYAITLWSNASSQLNLGLVKRRLIEANMYLNGVYSTTKPSNYTYVTFDNCGGTSSVKVQGYDSSLTSTPSPVPVLSGYRFMGWYTAQEGGSLVTTLDSSTAGSTLYAHWQSEGETTSGVTGTVISSTALNIRSAAGTSNSLVGAYASGATITIYEQTTVSGVSWGRTDKGWVCMTYVKLDSSTSTSGTTGSTSTETASGVTGTVISTTALNIRSAAGTTNSVVGAYASGATITIYEQTTVSGVSWGRTDKGWVCMTYVKLDSSTSTSSTTESTSTETTSGVAGTVISTTTLNIRSAAGTTNSVVGSYASGATVTIYEQTTVSGVSWGRTDKGWVCMTYVKLASSTSTSGTTESTSTETTSGVTGTVISTTTLNIRSAAGTTNSVVGSYASGATITIYEQTTVSGVSWGRTDKGWVCMTYVKLASSSSFTGTVTASALWIRSGAGTNNTALGSYAKGTSVTILEVSYVGTTAWGRTDKGWICLDYVNY